MGQILRREKVAEFVSNLHKSGKTVVATNGCFDILHVGHVRYLEKIKSFAGLFDCAFEFRQVSPLNKRRGAAN